jgi:hypothetical protein
MRRLDLPGADWFWFGLPFPIRVGYVALEACALVGAAVLLGAIWRGARAGPDGSPPAIPRARAVAALGVGGVLLVGLAWGLAVELSRGNVTMRPAP